MYTVTHIHNTTQRMLKHEWIITYQYIIALHNSQILFNNYNQDLQVITTHR